MRNGIDLGAVVRVFAGAKTRRWPMLIWGLPQSETPQCIGATPSADTSTPPVREGRKALLPRPAFC